MKLTKKIYCLIYRARKKGARINTRTRTIFYAYNDPTEIALVQSGMCVRLSKEFGFVIQSEIA